MAPWLRSLVAVSSPRPAWLLGLRMAAVVVVPLTVGLVVGELGYGLIASLGALNVGMADPGGAHRLRARTLLAATVSQALLLALGTLVGTDWWIAVPTMFVVAFAAGMSGAYGEVAGTVGFFSAMMFIIGTGLPGDGATALDRIWLVAIGGAWAMLLSLALWPLRPLRPAQLALGGAFTSLAAYVGGFADLARGGLRTAPGRTVLGSGDARSKLAAARETLNFVEATASGAEPAGAALTELADEGDVLLERAEALGERLAQLEPGSDPALREQLTGAVAALRGQVAAIGRVLVRRRGSPEEGVELERALSALDATVVAERAHVGAGKASIGALISVRGVELALCDCAAVASRAGDLAAEAVRAPGRRPAALRVRARRPDVGDWADKLRRELTPSSMLLRHSLRFATALAAGIAIAAMFDIQRGYWIDITIAVILRPYISTTFERGLQRVVGTLLGGFLAAGLISVVSGDVAVVFVLALLAFATFALLPVNYGWCVVFLTALVVLLVGFVQQSGTSIAIDRIQDTLIGGAIALAAALTLWPRSERDDYGAALADALAADRAFLAAVVAGQEGRAGRSDVAAHRHHAGSSADDLQARYHRLAGEPRRGREGLAATWEAVAGNRRLYVAIVALDSQLRLADGRGSGLAPIAQRLDDAIEAVAAASRSGKATPDALSRVDEALAAQRDEVAALADRRTRELAASTEVTPTGRALRADALVLSELDAAGTAVRRIELAVGALA